jgi:hypothetical protein
MKGYHLWYPLSILNPETNLPINQDAAFCNDDKEKEIFAWHKILLEINKDPDAFLS